MTGVVLVIVLHHQVPRRRLDRDPGDGRLLHAHAGHPPALRQRRPRAGASTSRATRSLPTRVHAIVLVSKLHKPTMRALAYAKATRPDVARGACTVDVDADETDGTAAEEWDAARHRRTAEGAGLAVPRDHPADRRLRHASIRARRPARRGRGLHPGVRRRPLVGAAAAQPDRAAAQGPAAVHAGRDGDLRALPAAVLRSADAARRAAPTRSAPRRRRAEAAATGTAAGQPEPGPRAARPRPSRSASAFEVDVGPVAHGGHCVARHDGTAWSFVRHALPGERVASRSPRARGLTGSCAPTPSRCSSRRRTGSRRRARTPARAAAAAATSSTSTLAAQRALKAAVVPSSCSRLAGLDVDVEVEAVPGRRDGLGWRTRVQYAVDDRRPARAAQAPLARGGPVDDCLIAHPLAGRDGSLAAEWPRRQRGRRRDRRRRTGEQLGW